MFRVPARTKGPADYNYTGFVPAVAAADTTKADTSVKESVRAGSFTEDYSGERSDEENVGSAPGLLRRGRGLEEEDTHSSGGGDRIAAAVDRGSQHRVIVEDVTAEDVTVETEKEEAERNSLFVVGAPEAAGAPVVSGPAIGHSADAGHNNRHNASLRFTVGPPGEPQNRYCETGVIPDVLDQRECVLDI